MSWVSTDSVRDMVKLRLLAVGRCVPMCQCINYPHPHRNKLTLWYVLLWMCLLSLHTVWPVRRHLHRLWYSALMLLHHATTLTVTGHASSQHMMTKPMDSYSLQTLRTGHFGPKTFRT